MALSVYVALDFILARRVEINTQIFKVDESGQLVKVDSKITPKLNLIQKSLVISLAVIYSAVVGLARYIEKADTLNQILFGWALGVWLAIIFAVFVRDRLFTHVKSILEVRTENAYYKPLLIVFCATLALLSVNVTIYYAQKQF
jgi:hypothetical protein